MGRIDKLFDTYTKRLSFVLLLIGLYFGYCLINNFSFGLLLYNVKGLAKLINISSNKLMYNTYLGQIVLNYLDTQANIPLSLFYAFGFFRILILFFLFIFMFSKLPSVLKGTKLMIFIGIINVIVGYAFVLGFIYLAMKSLTTDLAMINVNRAGLALIITSIIEIAYLLVSVFILLFKNIKEK